MLGKDEGGLHYADLVGQYLSGSSRNDEGVVYIKQTLLVSLSLFGLLGKDERGCIMQTLLVSLSLFGLLGKDEDIVEHHADIVGQYIFGLLGKDKGGHIMQALLVSLSLVCWGKMKGWFTIAVWFVGEG